MLLHDLRATGLNARTESYTWSNGTILRSRCVSALSAHLVRVLESIGLVRIRKGGNPIRVVCVPDIIWKSPKEVVRQFIAGYFEADGCVAGTAGVSATSKDESFLRDIQRLLLAFGIVSRLCSYQVKCQTGVVGIYWKLSLGKDAAEMFEKEIGFMSTRKRKRLSEISAYKHNYYRKMVWQDEVTAIRPCVITPVDIQVEGKEFVLAGFISHNSELKFVETAAMGVPLITSRVRPYIEFMKEGDTGFFATTPKEFAYKILMIMRNEKLARQVSDNAYRYMITNYNVDTNARKFIADIYAAMEIGRKT
jgi:hypothetical protein